MNRREAIAALMSLPATARISAAVLRPNDVIVLECDEILSTDSANHLRDVLGRIWPNHKVAVLQKGMRLRIAHE